MYTNGKMSTSSSLKLFFDLIIALVEIPNFFTIFQKVVITGAFKPECMKDSDADFNVGFALGALQTTPCPGVWVAMRGGLFPGAFVARTDTGEFIDQRNFL